MAKLNKIMVLFEDGKIRMETVLYAVELARRMESGITVLMLLTNNEINSEDFVEKNIVNVVEAIKGSGIQVKGEIRYGDKTSEFFKFLASDYHPSTIVWGSNAKVITKWGGKRGHWFSKAIRHIGCSIVTPTIKNSYEER